MLIVKGIAYVLGVHLLFLVAIVVLGRRVGFDVKLIANVGQFILGLGLGTTVAGAGLWMLGRLAASYLTRRMVG